MFLLKISAAQMLGTTSGEGSQFSLRLRQRCSVRFDALRENLCFEVWYSFMLRQVNKDERLLIRAFTGGIRTPSFYKLEC
jgi:hypothetical protein